MTDFKNYLLFLKSNKEPNLTIGLKVTIISQVKPADICPGGSNLMKK